MLPFWRLIAICTRKVSNFLDRSGDTFRRRPPQPNHQILHLQLKKLVRLPIVLSTLASMPPSRHLLYFLAPVHFELVLEEDGQVGYRGRHHHLPRLTLVRADYLNQSHHRLDEATVNSSVLSDQTSSLMANCLLFAVGRRMYTIVTNTTRYRIFSHPSRKNLTMSSIKSNDTIGFSSSQVQSHPQNSVQRQRH